VKQRANDQPVAGAVVTLATRQGTTDTQGRYTIDGIPVGTSQYRVEAGGFATVIGTLPTAIASGDNTVPDILLQPGVSDAAPGLPYSIQGRVTLTSQSNASGVAVAALDSSTRALVDQSLTTADGRYTLWVPPGPYRVRASRTGFTAQERDVTILDVNQPVTVDFVLAP
jgi:hypothetical protein